MERDDGRLKQRLEEVRKEEALLEQQIALQNYFANYIVSLGWPAVVATTPRRTNADLIQHRLLEAGVYYDDPIRTSELAEATDVFIRDMEATDCFHSVSVELGGARQGSTDSSTHQAERELIVKLNEKNWYRLHAGAGLKNDFFGSSHHNQIMTNSFLPTAEFEVSAGLRNIAGCLDTTDLQYSIDTHNIGTWKLHHKRPLYTLLPGIIGDTLLQSQVGSQYLFSALAALDTVDHDWLSSYRLFQRKLTMVIETPRRADIPWYATIEWVVANYRDLVPRRHATIPFQMVSSKEIVSLAGPSFKHALISKLEYDDVLRDEGSGLPVQGTQMRSRAEWALPPGDVGFLKLHVAGGHHWLLPGTSIAIHNCFSLGGLYSLSYGGLSRQQAILPSDRFILGGTGSLRGFSPGGLGPRSASIPTNKLGDALGSNFAYTITSMASVTPPFDLFGLSSQMRMFGFGTVGGCDSRNVRLATGVGVATQIFGPRLEVTYCWPLLYGPNDGKRRFQVGMTMSIA